MTPPVLRLKNLSKAFGAFLALKDITLDIEDGEFLTIVGPSGSGKTTLIRLMAGLDEPTGGEIWLREERVETRPANERPTCMVFQSLALFSHRSVGQNIEFSLKIRGVSAARRRRRAEELLELLRLPLAYYDKRIHECSGGEQQRVALARALAFEPEVLFFDEPLSALDYRLRKTLEKELKMLHARTGKTFVYITHSLEEAMVMSDRIAVLKDGAFEQIARADDIYARPMSRFVAEFMGEVNLFDLRLAAGGVTAADPIILSAAAQKQLAASLEHAPGRAATLMVRPEFIRLGGAGREDGDFALAATLVQQYELGSRIQYEFEAGPGRIITAEKLRKRRFTAAIGDTAQLAWSLADGHLIPGPAVPGG